MRKIEKRIILLNVIDEYVSGDGVSVGAQGSHDDVILRISFSESWEGTTKYVEWINAVGESVGVTLIKPSMMVENQNNVFDVPVPAGVKEHGGEITATIQGVIIDNETSIETMKIRTEEMTFRVLKSFSGITEVDDVIPSQAEQLQAEIDLISKDIVKLSNAATKARESADYAKGAAEYVGEQVGNAVNIKYEVNQIASEVRKDKEEIDNLYEKNKSENLLSVENLSKWSIVRESDNPDTPATNEYSHYAGVVDLSKENLDGIKGILTQLKTNSWTTSWTDFKYSEKLSLGDNFSINLTPFIQNREHAPNDAQIYEDTFVDIKFGSWSIRLFRWVRDQYQEYKNWPVNQTINPSSLYKLRIGLCMNAYDPETGALLQEDALVAYTDVVTTRGVVEDGDGKWIPDPDYPTTTLCNGAPSKTNLSQYNSQLMKYIRSFCVGNCGRPTDEYVETCFQRDFGYKDIKLTFEDGKVTVTDANDKAFKFHTPMYNSDYTIADEPLLNENTDYIDLKTLADMGVIPYPETNDIDVKVRMNHDRAVSVDYPLALMRFEITKNYSTNAIDDINNTSTEAVQQAFDITRRLDSEILDLYEIEDALMIDFDNPTSAINTRAWSVTWNTENRPYGLQGIRHPIVCVSNSFKEVQDKAVMVKRWIVSITETTPNQGRQWTNIYSEEDGWSGWRSVESISSHLPISKGGTGFGTPAEARTALGAASIEEMRDITNRVEALEALNPHSWDAVQKIVQSGLAPQMFPIGYQFTIHHDEYGDMLYDVVAHDYLKSAEDENAHTMTLLSHNIVLNAQYDASEAETDESGEFTNDGMRVYEGSNNYKESAIRQFLNSAEIAGNWWQAQTSLDLPPDYANQKNGFLYGLDSEFLNVVGTVNLPCSANGTYEHPDSEVTKGSAYILQDKFYLPSITEIVGTKANEHIVSDGSTVLPYYKDHVDDTEFSAKYTKEGAGNNYLTRTPHLETSFLTMYIQSSGGAYYDTAAQTYGIVPMCTIM